ncbi:hypothetical protein FZZ93_02420 [Halomonas eurihalina]|uniref:Uncharacterized protein n=1 Tax=Halomonas eurihalina TaxID=42566 RepID=A0A5D9DCT3_HALER|nr:hypothetical protein [Halomonas eurihalina]MDR5857951.1 hypothetical protein [Halomonas eurihalina]TZG41537.1 hypothetical protein FZZ93_02420 [Halomonas eurihalina]
MAKQPSAKATATPKSPPRQQVDIRAKTRRPGQRRQVCGVILTGEWTYLSVDDRGSAMKALSRDPDIIVERHARPKPPATKATEDDDA